MRIVKLFLAVAISSAVAPAGAHHSQAAMYVMNERVVIAGIVEKYEFINPHARVHVQVMGADGKAESWLVEGGTPVVLRRRGWTGEELKPGDRIMVTGQPARDGSKLVHWVAIKLPDGRELYGDDVDFDGVDRRRQR